MIDGDYCSGQSLEHPGDHGGVCLVPAEQTSGSDSSPDQIKRAAQAEVKHTEAITSQTFSVFYQLHKQKCGVQRKGRAAGP